MKELPGENEVMQTILKHTYREGDFLLSSGGRSDHYFDGRSIHQDPVLRDKFLDCFMFNVPTNADVIAGVQTGGASFASELAGRVKLAYSYARKEEKPYGMKRRIEGTTDVAGKNVVLIEDTSITGKGIIENAEIYRSAGAEVATAMTIILRDFEVFFRLEDIGISLIYFVGPNEIEEFRHGKMFPQDTQ